MIPDAGDRGSCGSWHPLILPQARGRSQYSFRLLFASRPPFRVVPFSRPHGRRLTRRPRFHVAPLGSRPEGAATNQPRATPWGPDNDPDPPSPERAQPGQVPSLLSRSLAKDHREILRDRVPCLALSGRGSFTRVSVPRALPWADLWLPLRGGTKQQRIPDRRVGFVCDLLPCRRNTLTNPHTVRTSRAISCPPNVVEQMSAVSRSHEVS